LEKSGFLRFRSLSHTANAESNTFARMNIKTIIFDLGGVLIDWNPDYVFNKVFEDPEKKRHFFENICTSDWNEEQDAGRTIKEATELLVAQHPEWKDHIEAYYGRWEEMLGGPIQDTVTIFKQLKETGRYKFYALTNWSAELFPIALERYDFLQWFDGRVVSGEEKMRKPFPQFYHLLLDRYRLNADEVLFIDDNLRNVKAAEELGIRSIRFQSPAQLHEDLKKLGIGLSPALSGGEGTG
jgi:2-haloacid dehalogenase